MKSGTRQNCHKTSCLYYLNVWHLHFHDLEKLWFLLNLIMRYMLDKEQFICFKGYSSKLIFLMSARFHHNASHFIQNTKENRCQIQQMTVKSTPDLSYSVSIFSLSLTHTHGPCTLDQNMGAVYFAGTFTQEKLS